MHDTPRTDGPAPPRVRPELLAPAGDRECMRAAVENGADAVYFGLQQGFNARARATNIEEAELPAAMDELHRRGVKGYVTANTLVFSDELEAFERAIRVLAAAQVDAVLVQDLGAVRLIREICPDLPIHASTQMTMTSAETIRVAERLGVERVVLARELSIDEIRLIHERTAMPLEAFVHGALCVAYSGQCLTSESLGGRSANRGQCAQACRLPYEVLCDGERVELGPVQYVLSPQDLAAYELVPQLIDAGVMSLKIEGRLKTPEYVANITRHYREAIDRAMADQPVRLDDRAREEMELSFSRGFSPGWLNGCDHKMLVPGTSSAKRGVRLGEIVQVRRGRVQVRLERHVKPGDGLVFAGDRLRGEEQGGRVYEVFVNQRRAPGAVERGLVELAFAQGALDFGRLWVGQPIWKTDDPELSKRLRKTFDAADPLRRQALDVEVRAVVGEPLVVTCRVERGAVCTVQAPEPLQAAERHAATDELFRTQLGRLGHTPYALRGVTAHIEGAPLVPLSVLGRLRREMIEQLEQLAIARPQRRLADAAVHTRWHVRRRDMETKTLLSSNTSPQLAVLCRSLEQLQTVARLPVDRLLVDFQDIREYREATAIAAAHGKPLYLATPRIQKPRENGIFRALLRHRATGILARNLSGLAFFHQQGLPTIADFSLNAANEITVAVLGELGAERVTASYDMNRDQLLALVAATDPAQLEVVVHQHMPMFHMEHCVFCAVLSPGTNKTNCGRPCDRHVVQLRDRLDMEHPLHADVGCRNTLFNAVPQSAAEVLPALTASGVRHFRVELLRENAVEIRRAIELYQQLLLGGIAAGDVWRELRAANRVGVTRGTLEERRNPLAIL